MPPAQDRGGLGAAADLDVEEVADADDEDVVIDEESPEEQELDAFIDGRKRPRHLDDD